MICAPCCCTSRAINCGSRTAAVPRITRSTPRLSAASTPPSSRRPPPRSPGIATAPTIAQTLSAMRRARAREAPAELHGKRHCPHDRIDNLRVDWPTRLRAIQIDDMQPLSAKLGPFARHVDRILIEHRHLGVVALIQPHTAAILDVDRRNDFER